jgi:hypothetical protein
MIYLSIALVIIAGMAAYLANKIIDRKYVINTVSAPDADAVAAFEEQLKKFDERLNNTWGTVSAIKTELESIRLAIAIKGR